MPTIAIALLCAAAALPDLRELQWRPIGPLRGGRTKAVAGVPQRPHLFYLGAVNGGVFRSEDDGRTWRPIFDDQPTASIGALAVAPSDPDVIYVGSGEGLSRPDLSVGDGVYKSSDGGRTFRHLGLGDAQQITQIAVDPRDPKRLFVSVLGHPYGPSEQRGIFRSLDGGDSFQPALHLDADTGGADVAIDPEHPDTVYATLWEHREAPWENGEFEGPGSGVFKSTDGGASWRRLTKGLPGAAEGLSRVAIAIAPSRTSRLFAAVAAKKRGGLYRSDDAGESWTRITSDDRVVERGTDLASVTVHPTDPDTVFTTSVVLWKSTDGGKTFAALRGAPGGDDYLSLWIDPRRPEVMIAGSDQGAIVTVDAGRTWSSWFNQPTAQMFHGTPDAAFPYRVCGGQQDSGSACVSSRGQWGEITARDWSPASFEEYGYAAPDPLDPDVVYGAKVSRWDRRTGQARDVSPVVGRKPGYRTIRTQPLLFSPLDPKLLWFASNTVWSTLDGGQSWAQRSPDLTRPTWDVPTVVGKYRGTEPAKPGQRGVVYALAPSPVDAQTVWAGTDDGLIHVTRDGGKSWREVTPPQLSPWAKVSVIEASHFDAGVAWAAINTLRLDDLRPHLLRTSDGGGSWVEVVAGLPEGAPVNVVREDPARRGLLFAGTERAVHFSLDGGDSWQPLRLNLPATSVRDLAVKGDDLVATTHGRGFWILDDLSPLRLHAQAAHDEPLHLYAPAAAVRTRWNTNPDTPMQPDEPMLPAAPEGALLHYQLREAATEVALEVRDASGALVRRFSSKDPAPPVRDEEQVPAYWIRPARPPSTQPGLHRLAWDLRHAPPASPTHGYSMAAAPGDTPREPRGPLVVPGRYTVRLIADGQQREQPLEVRLDPRLRTSQAELGQQLQLSLRVWRALDVVSRALPPSAPPDDDDEEEWRPPKRELPLTLKRLAPRLRQLLQKLQQADAAPTRALAEAAEEALRKADELLAAPRPR